MSDATVALRRAAGADDAAAVAEVWLRSYDAALPTVKRAHSDDGVRDYFRYVVVPEQETWLAESGGAVVGMMALEPGRIEQREAQPEYQAAKRRLRYDLF